MNIPRLDIVILSNAHNDYLKGCTHQTIETALKARGEKTIYVVEQQTIQWEHWFDCDVVTIPMDGEFNYNRFANFGASYGRSEYICIANNDLVFTEDWFAQIAASIHPVCSPHEPNDTRQLGLVTDEEGFEVGRHFSGWCFVISRELWKHIGGFDEDFAFWCADNSVVEQLKLAGITPRLVRKSIVHHLGSQTLKTAKNRDELTVNQVKKFNKKYHKNLFGWGV